MAILYVDVECMVCKENLGKRAKAKECSAHCKTCELTWYYRAHELTPYSHRKDSSIRDKQVPRSYGWSDPRYGGKEDPEWQG
jgi:hypothetical protein